MFLLRGRSSDSAVSSAGWASPQGVVVALVLVLITGLAMAAHSPAADTGGRQETQASATLTYSEDVPPTTSQDGSYSCVQSDTYHWTVTIPSTVIHTLESDPIIVPISGAYHSDNSCTDSTDGDSQDDHVDATQPGTIAVQVALSNEGGLTVYMQAADDDLSGLGQGLSGTDTKTYVFPDTTVPPVVTPTSIAPNIQDTFALSGQTTIPPSTTQPGTLTADVSGGLLPAPTAGCDAYWVRPGQQLHVAAPGVLGNDLSNGNGSLTAYQASNATLPVKFQVSGDGSLQFSDPDPGEESVRYFAYAETRRRSSPTFSSSSTTLVWDRSTCSNAIPTPTAIRYLRPR